MNDEPMIFKFPFKVLDWNVRGLGDLKKCAVIKDIVVEEKPDLVCFQETKWDQCDIFKLRQVCPAKFRNFNVLNAEGTRGGILLAWSNEYTSQNVIINSYSISAILSR